MRMQNLMRMTGLAGAVLLSTATLLAGMAGAGTATVALPRPPHTPIIKG
jgi:hypothetical protein